MAETNPGYPDFQEAVVFWRWWQEDSDSDMKVDGSPHAVIEDTLTTYYGHDEVVAEGISRAALRAVNYETRRTY